VTEKPTIDPSTFEAGRRYRVDHKDDRLRRSFVFTGTFLGLEERTRDDETTAVMMFEVKPRFGPPARQPVDPATITSIEPA
jgi:hypothetical protein